MPGDGPPRPAPAAGGAARLSPCGAHRYWLSRSLGGDGGTVTFVMLNPSTADAAIDDPTIRRCVGFARSLGAERLLVVNLFSLRATDPRALYAHPAPAGPGNDRALRWAARQARPGGVICAWGAHGALRGAGTRVAALLQRAGAPLQVLGLTADGEPRHPLYLPASARPRPWRPLTR
jgi:hypothetical protein